MPISFRYNSELKLVIFIHEGRVTDEKFTSSYQAFFKDPKFDQYCNYLVDLRMADSTSRNPKVLLELAEFVQRNFGNTSVEINIAVVAPQAVSYNLALMYEIFSSTVSWRFNIFHEILPALDWLGVPSNLADSLELDHSLSSLKGKSGL